MKTELEQQDIEAIALKVVEFIKPLISGNGKHEAEDTLMDIEDASKFLKSSKGQIYQWVNNAQHGLNDFPYLKAGKRLRFSKQALMKWLESR